MEDRPELEKIVKTLVSATDPKQVKSLYKQWADTYDEDLNSYGYVAPGIGVGKLAELLENKQALIHDAGCGTGQVGALLAQLGYTNIHGSDFSAQMLEKAALLGCYQQLCSVDFGAPVKLDTNSYDAVISIGVYTKRFKQYFIDEMIRIVRPGGYFVFSCRELYFDEVMELSTSLIKNKTIVSMVVDFDDYMVGQGASAYYIVLKKTAV